MTLRGKSLSPLLKNAVSIVRAGTASSPGADENAAGAHHNESLLCLGHYALVHGGKWAAIDHCVDFEAKGCVLEKK